jgi:hypothetical protein
MRKSLPNRRLNITDTIEYIDVFAQGQPMRLEITFGFDRAYVLREVFISSRSHPLTPMINDICILISRLLQWGDCIESIAEGLGENRNEGEARGRPSSFIGSIARHGVKLQAEILAKAHNSE